MWWMRLIMVVAIAVGVATPVARLAAHPPSILSPAAERATAEEIVAFRSALVAAIAAKDVVTLKVLYTEGFIHAHTSGKVDGRDARIVSALVGEPVIETAEVNDLRIHVPGGWTAIATGLSPITSLADGRVYAVRWITVYVRGDKGAWQLAASQATRVGEWSK